MPRGRPRKVVSPCRFCNTEFKRVEHLRRHERIHTQEKPFACECGQAFSRKDLLARHTKLYHGNTDERLGSTDLRLISGTTSPSEQLHNSKDGPTNIAEPSFSQMSPPLSDGHHSRLNNHPNAGFSQAPSSTEPSLEPSAHLSPVSDDLQLAHGGNDPLTDLTSIADFLPQSNTSQGPLYNTFETFSDMSDNMDFIWDQDFGVYDFLPTSFFDTTNSLSDVWRTGISIAETNTLPTPFSEDLEESGTSLNAAEQSVADPPLSQRLPPNEPDYELTNHGRLPIHDIRSITTMDAPQGMLEHVPWNISNHAYRQICEALQPYEQVLHTDFSMPSRRSLSRFVEAYFQDFHQHLPFLHVPTTVMGSLTPGLVLAIAAAGAFYRLESIKGQHLLTAARAVIALQTTNSPLARDYVPKPTVTHTSARNASRRGKTVALPLSVEEEISPSDRSATPCDTRASLQIMQALTIVVALASWSDKPMSHDALVLATQLAILVREGGISSNDAIRNGTEWLEWIRLEERRRTLFVAYVLFNMQSIAFNVPPAILNQDIHLCLPHCGSEWEATNAAQFMHLRHMYGHDERPFREALEEILLGRSVHAIGPLSAFGNYVLMIGLVQTIFLERHVLRSISSRHTLMSPDTLISYESALRYWQLSWEATQESSLDLSSPKGPLGFDAAALLSLAYIRLNSDMGPSRDLMSKDPEGIARGFLRKDDLQLTRSPHLDRAVLQCIHALSRPVRLGIPYVSKVLTVKRSVQHALCNLECAYLLSRWLNTMADVIGHTNIQALREDERILLGMIATLIEETDIAHTLHQNENDAKSIRRMGSSIVRLWADTFNGPHVFYTVDTVGTILSIAADMLEAQAQE